jgi:hypothetical protein
MITLWKNRSFTTQLAIAILNCNNHLQFTIFLQLEWYRTSCKSCNGTIHHIWNQYTYAIHVTMLQLNHCYYCVTMLQLLWYYVVTTMSLCYNYCDITLQLHRKQCANVITMCWQIIGRHMTILNLFWLIFWLI